MSNTAVRSLAGTSEAADCGVKTRLPCWWLSDRSPSEAFRPGRSAQRRFGARQPRDTPGTRSERTYRIGCGQNKCTREGHAGLLTALRSP
ncbi:hypothetical protein DKG71_18850 [Streptomyces sp. NEAU-S7GS2]|nr:hypothetical protein DKG71_18850 [Streptomyces sp. NEAU-S7GS2]